MARCAQRTAFMTAAHRFLDRRGLRSDHTVLDRIGAVSVNGVRLFDGDGNERAWGLARTTPGLSESVATAEAIEHLLVSGGAQDLFVDEIVTPSDSFGAEGEDTFGDQLMRWMRARGNGVSAVCRRFTRCSPSGPDKALMPRFLVDLGYWRTNELPGALRSFVRYGSSTGWSVASTPEDARTRALIEVLERDLLSRFMLSIYLGRSYPCGYLKRQEIPEHLAGFLAAVEDWLHLDVFVLGLSSREGLHVCLASARDDAISGRIVGKGADADPWLAASRAIGELCQMYAVSKSAWLKYDDDGHRVRLGNVAPRFLAAYESRICPGELPFDTHSWTPDKVAGTERSPWAAHWMEAMRRPVYESTVELVEDALYSSNVYVPGAERFFLAGHGIEVVPTGDRPLLPGVPGL